MPPAELDFSACLARVRSGDDEAARDLVEQLYPKVIRIVRSHLPRRMAEEDLAQEVFLKMFTRLDQYEARDGKPFDHWLARLTVRTCLDALRAERRRPEWRLGDFAPGDGEEREWLDYLASSADQPEPTHTLGAREAVEKLLSHLGAEDRLVLTLLDMEQRSVAEIASLTGWGESRIKVRAHRARRKLRKVAESLNLTFYE
jgi:RNA polymerase sigma-70 factor (ECF subfamily)